MSAHAEPGDPAMLDMAVEILSGYTMASIDETRWTVRRSAALKSLGHNPDEIHQIVSREAFMRPWEDNGLRW